MNLIKRIVPLILSVVFCSDGLGAASQFASVVERCRTAYKTPPEISVFITDLKTGDTVYEFNADIPRIPASNQKILSSVFALERLGQDFEFTTGVYLSSDFDLVVMGSFDPLLGDPEIAGKNQSNLYWQVDRWVEQMKSQLGGRVIRNIMMIIDRQNPLGRHKDWPEKQDGRAYQAPVMRINFHDNTFGVVFDEEGGSIVPRLVPYTRFVTFSGKVTKGAKHIWGIRPNNEDESELKIWGTVSQATNVPYYASCDRPEMLLGRVLAERLLSANVDFTGNITAVDYREVPQPGRLIVRTSNSLKDVLKRANKDSLNLAAEAMLLRAGTGSWDTSGDLLERIFINNFAVEPGHIKCADGCGLSRNNRVTARAISRILGGVVTRPYFDIFLESLSISGTDGTLQRRMRESPVGFRVSAKTGYIYGVSCLSGYVKDNAGQPRFAFSFLVNGIQGSTANAKKMQDDLCRMLAKLADNNE